MLNSLDFITTRVNYGGKIRYFFSCYQIFAPIFLITQIFNAQRHGDGSSVTNCVGTGLHEKKGDPHGGPPFIGRYQLIADSFARDDYFITLTALVVPSV